MKQPVYEVLAGLVQAMHNCHKSGNGEWLVKHSENARQIVRDFLPSGSGWDNGTKLEDSEADKLVFSGAFHHMDENGFYDGWTDHVITVRPSLTSQVKLSISGRDRNEIKDYLHEMFDVSLRTEIQYDHEAQRYVLAL